MVDNFQFKDFYTADDLLRIVEILRAPGGCPWDAEQRHESIKKDFIEETYEVIEAINKKDKVLFIIRTSPLIYLLFYIITITRKCPS